MPFFSNCCYYREEDIVLKNLFWKETKKLGDSRKFAIMANYLWMKLRPNEPITDLKSLNAVAFEVAKLSIEQLSVLIAWATSCYIINQTTLFWANSNKQQF